MSALKDTDTATREKERLVKREIFLRKKLREFLRQVSLQGRSGCSFEDAYALMLQQSERRRKLSEEEEEEEEEEEGETDRDLDDFDFEFSDDGDEDDEDEDEESLSLMRRQKNGREKYSSSTSNTKYHRKLKRMLFERVLRRSSMEAMRNLHLNHHQHHHSTSDKSNATTKTTKRDYEITKERFDSLKPDVHFVTKVPNELVVNTTETLCTKELELAEEFVLRESFEFAKKKLNEKLLLLKKKENLTTKTNDRKDKQYSSSSSSSSLLTFEECVMMNESNDNDNTNNDDDEDDDVNKNVVSKNETDKTTTKKNSQKSNNNTAHANRQQIFLVASQHARDAILGLIDMKSWDQVISPFSKRILEHVAKQRQIGCTTMELSRLMNMKASKLDPHARQIEGLRLGVRRKVFRQETKLTESAMWLPEFLPRKSTALNQVVKKKYADRLFRILEEAGKKHAVPLDLIKPQMAHTLSGLIYDMNRRRSQKLFGELRKELVEKKCILLGQVTVENEITGEKVTKEALQLIKRPLEYTYVGVTMSSKKNVVLSLPASENEEKKKTKMKGGKNDEVMSAENDGEEGEDVIEIDINEDADFEPPQYTTWTGKGSRELVLEQSFDHQLLQRIADSSLLGGVSSKTLGIEFDISTKPLSRKLEKFETMDKLLNKKSVRSGSHTVTYYTIKEVEARKRGFTIRVNDVPNVAVVDNNEKQIVTIEADEDSRRVNRNDMRLKILKAHVLNKGFEYQSRLGAWLAKEEKLGLTRVDAQQVKYIVEELLKDEGDKFSQFYVEGLSGKGDTVLCSSEFLNTIDHKNLTEEFINNMLAYGEKLRLAKRKIMEQSGTTLPQLEAFDRDPFAVESMKSRKTKDEHVFGRGGDPQKRGNNNNNNNNNKTFLISTPKTDPVDVPFERLRYEYALRLGLFRSQVLRCRALHLHLVQEAKDGCISAHDLRKNMPVKLHFQLASPPIGLTTTQFAKLYVAIVEGKKFSDLDKTLAKAAYDSDAIGDVLKGLKNMELWTHGTSKDNNNSNNNNNTTTTTTTIAINPPPKVLPQKRKQRGGGSGSSADDTSKNIDSEEKLEENGDIGASIKLSAIGTYANPNPQANNKKRIEMNVQTLSHCEAYWNALEATFKVLKDIEWNIWPSGQSVSITQSKCWNLAMVVQDPKEALRLSIRFEDLWKRWVQSAMDVPYPNHAHRRYPMRSELAKPENVSVRNVLALAQRKIGLKPVMSLKETAVLAFALKQISSDGEYESSATISEKRVDALWKNYAEAVHKTLVGGDFAFGMVDNGSKLGVKNASDSGVLTEIELQQTMQMSRKKSKAVSKREASDKQILVDDIDNENEDEDKDDDGVVAAEEDHINMEYDDDDDEEDDDGENEQANLSSRLHARLPRMNFDAESDALLLSTVMKYMIIAGLDGSEPPSLSTAQRPNYGNASMAFKAERESWIDRYKSVTELAFVKRWRVLCKHSPPMGKSGDVAKDLHKYAKMEFDSGKISRAQRDQSLLNSLLTCSKKISDSAKIKEEIEHVTDAIQGRERALQGEHWHTTGEWAYDIQLRTSDLAKQILLSNEVRKVSMTTTTMTTTVNTMTTTTMVVQRKNKNKNKNNKNKSINEDESIVVDTIMDDAHPTSDVATPRKRPAATQRTLVAVPAKKSFSEPQNIETDSRKVAKKFTQIKFNKERRERNDNVGEPTVEIRKKAIEIYNKLFVNVDENEEDNDDDDDDDENGADARKKEKLLPVKEINASSMLAYISAMITNKIDIVCAAEEDFEVSNPSDASWAFKVLCNTNKAKDGKPYQPPECFGFKNSFNPSSASVLANNEEEDDDVDDDYENSRDVIVEREIMRFCTARLNASESDIIEFVDCSETSAKRALKYLTTIGNLLARKAFVKKSNVPRIFLNLAKKKKKKNDAEEEENIIKTEKYYSVPLEKQIM